MVPPWSRTRTVDPASPVKMMTGLVSLTIVSEVLVSPGLVEMLAISAAAGAVVSTVVMKLLDAADALPAPSITLALMV